MLRSDLCDFSDAYIIVKGDITATNPNNAKRNKAVLFKNNATFINGISKINGIKIDNAEDLDVIMPMYNLLEINQVILFQLILNLSNIKQILELRYTINQLWSWNDFNLVKKLRPSWYNSSKIIHQLDWNFK